MRVYFEKPRTVTGWKGLINDPGMDGTHDVHRGLRMARRFLLDVVALGLPVGCEWLDPITPQYIADAVAWGAIGARTTESQVHRQLASGLSMPIGFKNGTDGDVQVAVDACRAAAAGHTFFGVDPGRAAPRSSPPPATPTATSSCAAGGPAPTTSPRRCADGAGDDRRGRAGPAGHGGRQPRQQRQGLPAPARRGRGAGRARSARGEQGIVGIMLESFLQPGRQEPGDPATLVYGQSVTDACIDVDATAEVLRGLAAAVRQPPGRRAAARAAARDGPPRRRPGGRAS